MSDEYLTIGDVAALLRVSPKRIRNLMSAGVFRQGEHFYRRSGLGPRFKQSAVTAWLEGQDEPREDAREVQPVDECQLPRSLDLHRVPYSPPSSSISTWYPTGRVA